MSRSAIVRDSLEMVFCKYGKQSKFVIYPFGDDGKLLKCILNYEFGILEYAIIDNKLSDVSNKINKISWLKEHQDVIVLVSSSRWDYYNVIRKDLYKNIEKDRCVEVFRDVTWPKEYYPEIMRLSKVHATSYDLVRVGNSNDGGYVMADVLPGGIAYSFGISNDPSWDLDMRRRGYEIYMYDHTCPPPEEISLYGKEMHFFKIGLKSLSDECNLMALEDIVRKNGHENESEMILKIDVEGAEWGAFLMTPSHIIEKFRQIVVEFHGINTVDVNKKNVLAKLYETHRVVHIHGNNNGNDGRGNFISSISHNIPDTWECTYLRRDYVEKEMEHVKLPIPEDRPCNKFIDEIILGDWNAEFLC